jgi:hypothetical protein
MSSSPVQEEIPHIQRSVCVRKVLSIVRAQGSVLPSVEKALSFSLRNVMTKDKEAVSRTAQDPVRTLYAQEGPKRQPQCVSVLMALL